MIKTTILSFFILAMFPIVTISQSYSLFFNGQDSYVDLGTELNTNIRTIELWFNLSEKIDQDNNQAIGLIARNHYQTNSGEYHITFIPQYNWGGMGGSLRFTCVIEGGIHMNVFSNNNVWENDRWYHVAAVIHPQQGMMLFIDGEKQSSINQYKQAIEYSTYKSCIGRWGDMNDRHFKGYIDAIRFSDEALYTENFTPECDFNNSPAFKALYKFDNPESNIAVDETGNGHEAEIHNSEYVLLNACENEHEINGLLVHYPLDGNALDLSGNNFNGTTHHARPAPDRFCDPEGAMYFDGIDDYINFSDESALEPDLPVSMAFWVYFDELSLGILTTDHKDDAHTGCWFSLNSDGNIGLAYGDGGTPNPTSRRSFITNSKVVTGQWYHIAGVIHAPQQMDIYINGELQDGYYEGSGGNIVYSEYPGSLGCKDADTNGPPYYFNGRLDDFYYWNTAISFEQVQELYTPVQSINDLLAYYPLDGNAFDNSGNGFNGELINVQATYDRHDNPRSAVELNGKTSYITLPTESALKPQFPISIAFWAQPISYGGGIIATDYSQDSYSGLWFYFDQEGHPVIAYGNGGINESDFKAITGDYVISTSEWQHFAAIINNPEDIHMYVDFKEVKVSQDGSAYNIAYNCNPAIVGNSNFSAFSQKKYHGKLDELYYYHGELNLNQFVEDIPEEETAKKNIDLDQETNFKVYPNPVNDIMYIYEEEIDIKRIQIVDTYGLVHIDIPFKNELDLSNLQKGIYFIRLIQQKTVLNSRRILKR
ncbi:MAG: T9SS type A sorting domain-containing protein [Bacteroidales bacterium]|nr:T9SS type A sorting domain-containing protein [Bacteroidales bacterium]